MPARERHLRNAPITEALLDFRVAQCAVRVSDAREALTARLPDYPDVGKMDLIQTRVDVAADSSTLSREQQFRGFLFKAADGRRLTQFRLDGFTFNLLKPYTDFDQMRSEALRLWQIYVEVLQPTAITRAAVRYINHLGLPAAIGDLSRYLSSPPSAPAGIGYSVNGFLERLMLIDQSSGITVHVTQASEQSLKQGETTVILDVDAFMVSDYEPRDARLPAVLESLRGAKNRVFFASIEEDAASMWE